MRINNEEVKERMSASQSNPARSTMTAANFNGLRVLSLESRRAVETAKLIRTYGGEPLVAPAMVVIAYGGAAVIFFTAQRSPK